MDWTYDRAALLPRSGVGVVEHWLVIAPLVHSVIRIDLRALDEVWQGPRRSRGLRQPGKGGTSAMLELADLSVQLFIADGPDAVAHIVDTAAPHVRGSSRSHLPSPAHFVFVGDDVVCRSQDKIQVGNIKFHLQDVRDYAKRGANLPLTGGRLLQAAVALLVVAAEE